ncbi:hypothetical protein CWO33_23660 [Vibrio splendidus]|uniref:restriction endonuclease subunit S n=1 Tax=Vibrio splendidus TaxID=29497 RepID=UPI000D384908|nr:restriction endonuclease subunit S [Vibrio splendidus]PTQ04661.1 hypothetical protein CWO33_23660 [Vibrio splendidus]
MSNLVPEGWNSSPISDVLNKIIDFRGRTPKKLGMTWGGGNIRALSANNVQMGKVNFQKECYLASIELYQKWMTKGETEKGDVLFTMEAPLGNVALVPNDDRYILSQRVILLKHDRTKVLSDFLFQQMRSDSFQNVLRENATGSTALGIQQKRLITLDIVLPPLPEQKKIAAILTSVDEVIEKTQAQINKLKDLKTGMMQELLTRGVGVDGKPHVEFKDSPVGRIPKGWDVVPISALCSHIVDCVNKTAPVVDYKTPYKMIRTTNVRHGRVDTENVRSVTKETYELWVRRLVPQKGDLIFTREAPVGECGILEDERGVFLGQRTMMYRADTIKTSSHFLMYSLMSEYGKKQLEDFSGGSTVPHMRVPDCGKILVKIPPKNEQDLIVRSLKSVDAAITNKEAKLQKVNDTKKALMQDLLTGKVRVKVEG